MKSIFLYIMFVVTSLSCLAQEVDTVFQNARQNFQMDKEKYRVWKSLDSLVEKYYMEGNFSKALEYALKGVETAKNEFGKENNNYAISCNNLAAAYAAMGDYKKALPFYLEAKGIRERILGKEHPDYALSCYNLAVYYESTGDYQKALPLCLEAMEIREKLYGKENPLYGASCSNLAYTYESMGDYQKALPLYLEAKKITENSEGKENYNYTSACNNLGSLYYAMGDYRLALQLFIETKEVRERVLGKDHPEYAASRNNLAVLYFAMGYYRQALALFIEAKEFLEKVSGKEQPDYASCCNNLSVIYSSMGQYQQALEESNEARQIYIKIYGKEHSLYANSCNNLAEIYETIGEYRLALPLYSEARQLLEKIVGKEHPDYAVSCNNLAGLYKSIGDYRKSLELFKEAKQVREKALGKEHPDYAASCRSLAGLYWTIGEFGKALELFLESRQIYEKAVGREHPDYAVSCDNLSMFYQSMGDYQKALQLCLEAKQIWEKVVGKSHPDYASSCNNLGLLYQESGNKQDALQLFWEAKEIDEKVLGKNHPDYANTCYNLASLYESIGDFGQAENMVLEINKSLNNQIRENFGFLTGQEKELFIRKIAYNFESFNSFSLRYKSKKPEFVAFNYDNELAHKGMVLQSNLLFRKAIVNSGDTSLIDLSVKLNDVKILINKLYKTNAGKEKTDSLEKIADDLEKALVRLGQKLPELQKSMEIGRIKWQDIQKKLGKDECAIEFTSFRYFDRNKWTDSTFYCALVLRKGYSCPKMIYLCEAGQLEKFMLFANGNSGSIDYLYNRDGSTAYPLYKLIWQPIDSLLQDVKTVYLTPSGLLHKIAFSAIPLPGQKYLSDVYKLNIVSSTAVLLQDEKKYKIDAGDKALVYGGIEYSTSPHEMKKYSAKYQVSQMPDYAFRGTLAKDSSTRGQVWEYLEGSLEEALKINDLLLSSKIKSILMKGPAANEESFKSLAGKAMPEIIHIATHGFYFPWQAEELKQTGRYGRQLLGASENPLSRSGLLFAGANAAWKNDSLPPDMDDGILTSLEISQMYLPTTKLVVVSACETGLGDIKGDEGVYGIQRAFKMAGANFLVLSLWPVPDRETSELMQEFYRRWLSGKPIQEAFRLAQNQIKKKYRDEPSKWAAFVLIN